MKMKTAANYACVSYNKDPYVCNVMETDSPDILFLDSTKTAIW